MRIKTLICLIPLLLLTQLAALPSHEPPPEAVQPGPTPGPAPAPAADEGSPVQQIFQIVFQDRSLADALTKILQGAAEDEAGQLAAQTASWAALLGELLQSPASGYFEAVAGSSLFVAAAMAPALFLLRLALYHWNRLFGAEDSPLSVLGDWLAAGLLAAAAGPFLDLLAALSWWLAGAVLGETAQLAQAFVQATSVLDALRNISLVSLFTPVLYLGVSLGGVLAMAGMLFAFGAAQAALYLMALLAPPVAVAAAVPQLRWLRALWFKAAALLALLPLLAGGIFKASVSLGLIFSGDGLLSPLMRLLWLWGAVGSLLSVGGILGRVTLSASLEALQQAAGAVRSVAGIAALAASAGASGGTLAAGEAAGGPEAGMLAHLNQARAWNRQAGQFEALGLQAPARYARSQARDEDYAFRQLALAENAPGAADPGIGTSGSLYTESIEREILAGFSGSRADFDAGLAQLEPQLRAAGLTPELLAQTYPQETGRLVRAFRADPAGLAESRAPLLEAARRAGAHQLLQVFSDAAGTTERGPLGGSDAERA